jgi:predicted esterase YcpF (UPF0227 family)
MKRHHYLYLHGFASSPHSSKAQYLKQRFAERKVNLLVLDLNQPDFSSLTLTRQLQQVESIITDLATPVTIIGSSLGGLTAAWLGEKHHQVQRLILLAPAFEFLQHWLPTLGDERVNAWRETNSLLVYHYGEKQPRQLHYHFVEDVQRYPSQALQRPILTLILHGCRDEVIPIEESRHYCQSRPWVELIELDSDHALGDVQPQIWQAISSWGVMV